MPRVLIWDVPVRVIHWLLAGGFVAAASIALILGEESLNFPYHSIIGLVIGMLVLVRLLWGVVGSRHARLPRFFHGPAAMLGYFRTVLQRAPQRTYAGHNPGSGPVLALMLALLLGVVTTGVMISRGVKAAKDPHEILVYVTIGLVIAHIAGVLLHTVVRRDPIALSMIHGRKSAPAQDAIPAGHLLAGLGVLIITAAWTGGLLRGYDPKSQTLRLPLAAAELRLGEGDGSNLDEFGSETEHEQEH